AGRIAYLRWDEDVRVDSGYEEGSLVTTSYDPLIAKLIARADTRAGALAKLERALERSDVLGVRTNREFLLAPLRTAAMREGSAVGGSTIVPPSQFAAETRCGRSAAAPRSSCLSRHANGTSRRRRVPRWWLRCPEWSWASSRHRAAVRVVAIFSSWWRQ